MDKKIVANDQTLKEFEENGHKIIVKDDNGITIYKSDVSKCNGCRNLRICLDPYEPIDPLGIKNKIAYCLKYAKEIDYNLEGIDPLVHTPEWCNV